MEYHRLLHHRHYTLAASEHQTLEQAIALTEHKHNDCYLSKVAGFIAQHTQAQYVLIGTLSPDGFQVETKAFIKDFQEQPNMAYPLQHSPCDHVITQRFCYYPNHVQQLFPYDLELQELNIESYLGSIFLDGNNEPMGLIALMSEDELQNAAFAEHLVLVLSPSIEEELLRSGNNPPAA